MSALQLYDLAERYAKANKHRAEASKKKVKKKVLRGLMEKDGKEERGIVSFWLLWYTIRNSDPSRRHASNAQRLALSVTGLSLRLFRGYDTPLS